MTDAPLYFIASALYFLTSQTMASQIEELSFFGQLLYIFFIVAGFALFVRAFL